MKACTARSIAQIVFLYTRVVLSPQYIRYITYTFAHTNKHSHRMTSTTPFIIGVSGGYQSGKDTVGQMFLDVLKVRQPQRYAYTRSFSAPLKRVLAHYLRPQLTMEDMETDVGKNKPLPPRPVPPTVHSNALFFSSDANDDIIAQRVLEIALAHPVDDGVLRVLVSLVPSNEVVDVEQLCSRIVSALAYFESKVYDGTVQTVGQALQILGTECFRNRVASNFWVALQEMLLLKAKPSDIVIFTDLRFPNEYAYIESKGGIPMRVLRKVDYSKSTRDPNHYSEIALRDHTFKHIIDNNGPLSQTRAQVDAITQTVTL